MTNIYIGTIADSVFFDRARTIVPATDLTLRMLAPWPLRDHWA